VISHASPTSGDLRPGPCGAIFLLFPYRAHEHQAGGLAYLDDRRLRFTDWEQALEELL